MRVRVHIHTQAGTHTQMHAHKWKMNIPEHFAWNLNIGYNNTNALELDILSYRKFL